jgi:hypothetical protein
VSDDFTWNPDPASGRQTNIAVVLAFVGLGVVASSFYPLKLMPGRVRKGPGKAMQLQAAIERDLAYVIPIE